MKKKIFLFGSIIFALTVNNCQAQNSDCDTREKLQVGVKVGANLSNVYDTQGDQFKSKDKLGFAAGCFVAIPLNKIIGFQPELLFSQKGFQATGQVLAQNYDFTRTTSYIDVPLLLAIKPIQYITILVGPEYSYLINQKDMFTSSTSSLELEQQFENENIRKNTLCFTGGADIKYSHLVFSARLAWDLLNNNGNGTSSIPRYKNVWYQATIGFVL